MRFGSFYRLQIHLFFQPDMVCAVKTALDAQAMFDLITSIYSPLEISCKAYKLSGIFQMIYSMSI